jgi:Fic family protein
LEREEAKSSWQLSSGKNDNPFSFCFSGATFSEEDRREIDDIVAATNYGIDVMEQLPLSTRLFKQIHYLVARSPRYEKKYPGEYRTSPVWIGRVGSDLRTAQFVAPVEEDMIPAITALENYINYDNSEHPLVQAALIHYQFEAIHPFIDCNGRVGRILNTLFLIERGLLEHPVLPISESLKRVAAQYYMLLQEVSDTGNYDMWVKFFLRMVTDSALTSNRILTDE